MRCLRRLAVPLDRRYRRGLAWIRHNSAGRAFAGPLPSFIPDGAMTDVQTTEPPVPGDPQTDTPTPEVKAPEPWTATKVLEWNAYYDIYVALGVLLLAFLSSANQLTT